MRRIAEDIASSADADPADSPGHQPGKRRVFGMEHLYFGFCTTDGKQNGPRCSAALRAPWA